MKMATRILTGIVLPDGKIEVQGESDLQPGQAVQVVVEKSWIPESASIEEVKQWLDEPEQEMTTEGLKHYHAAWALLDSIARDDLDLPEDYVDELDHYLYGTPKRSENPDGLK
jgi:hypothetical protein